MKRLLLLAIAIYCFDTAQAQTTLPHLLRQWEYWYGVPGGIWQLVDSAHYYYSGNGPHRLTEQSLWNFDSAHHYSDNWPTMMQTDRQKLNAAGQVTEQYVEGVFSSQWQPLSRLSYSYDAHGNLETTETEWRDNSGGLKKIDKSARAYNSANALISQTGYDWDAASMHYKRRDSMHITYNVAGEKIMEAWYGHNGSSWAPVSRSSYSYTGGYLTSEQQEAYTAGNWVVKHDMINTYNALNLLVLSVYRTRNGSGWDTTMCYEYLHDSHGNVLEQHMKTWDGTRFVNNSREVYTYNSHHQVVRYQGTGWQDNGGWLPGHHSPDVHYEYGYTTVVGTGDVPVVNNNLNIYPNPAGSVIMLQTAFDKPQAYNGALYDATGKAVKRYEGMAVGRNTMLNVQDVAPGNYILKLAAGNSIVNRQVVIAR